MKKRVIVVGAGTAGVIVASLLQQHYGDVVEITVIYDGAKDSIGVGEGTRIDINDYLKKINLSGIDLIKNAEATIKLVIQFRNWLPKSSYFHPFHWKETKSQRIQLPNNITTSHCFYEMMTKFSIDSLLSYDDCSTVPSTLKEDYAYHIDGVLFSRYIRSIFKKTIQFIEDKVVDVICNENSIASIRLENNGILTGDYYIDCSGFSKLLYGKLNNLKWKDVSSILPINRALIQQIPIKSCADIPSHTVSEATKDGWIWQIPVGSRYGTGYLYSSNFTTDDKARIEFDNWLNKNHNERLTSDRIIKYDSGYYENFCASNCAAIGLASGFVEPLEATGITLIFRQIEYLIKHDVIFSNIEYNRQSASKENKLFYEELISFIDLHYCTNRIDSEFWEYKTNTKTEYVRNFEELCKYEFLTSKIINHNSLVRLESYIQIAKGLNLFGKKCVTNFLSKYTNKHNLLFESKRKIESILDLKQKVKSQQISHREFLSQIVARH